MNPLVIAVDTGNKNIKTPHTEPFNSGLICHGAIPPAVKSDTLLFDGNYYTLTQSRIPYMYNKTTDWSYYVLTLIAIAKEMMAMGYVRPGQKQVKQDVCLALARSRSSRMCALRWAFLRLTFTTLLRSTINILVVMVAVWCSLTIMWILKSASFE